MLLRVEEQAPLGYVIQLMYYHMPKVLSPKAYVIWCLYVLLKEWDPAGSLITFNIGHVSNIDGMVV